MKRLNLIIGAGSILDSFPDMSTSEITDKISSKPLFEKPDEITDDSNKEAMAAYTLWELREKIENIMNRKVNFEELYQVVMDIILYKYCKCHEQKPISVAITDVDQSIADEIDLETAYKMHERIMREVYQDIAQYSKKSPDKWFFDFFHTLSSTKKVSVFNLNYDTWIEQSFLEYNDGYCKQDIIKDYAIFIPKKAMCYENTNLINHMHGCVNFNFVPSEESHKKNTNSIYKYDQPIGNYFGASPIKLTQNGITYVSPIITGLRKNDNIMIEPFASYYCNFVREMTLNDTLLIIGYGFGDLHVNAMLVNYYFAKDNGKKVIVVSPELNDGFFNKFAGEEDTTDELNIKKTLSGSVYWFKMGFKDAVSNLIFIDIIRKITASL